MNTAELAPALTTLMSELTTGTAPSGGFVLNRGDAGLLAALDRIDAATASRVHAGGSSIAAHVAHVTYGIELFNRWAQGENPFLDANWSASWELVEVDERAWAERRQTLQRELEQWIETLRTPRDVIPIELTGMIASIVHLAYHVGAIRQMDRTLRGPSAND